MADRSLAMKAGGGDGGHLEEADGHTDGHTAATSRAGKTASPKAAMQWNGRGIPRFDKP